MQHLYTGAGFTYGRDKIYQTETITPSSVIRVVKAALQTHQFNQMDIEWLFMLYRGRDDRIINRNRATDSTINYKAIVNMYAPIVDTKAGLLCQSPVTFVSRSVDDKITEEIEILSRMYNVLNIQPRDKEAATQIGVCGVSYRFVEIDEKYRPGVRNGHYPFKISILNPTNVFSIWGDDTDSEPVAMVYMTQELDPNKGAMMGDITNEPSGIGLRTRFHVYTNDWKYEFAAGDTIPVVTAAMPWGIPIVERVANPYRIGFFERVQSLIYARSVLRSDQINSVAEFVNAIWLAVNIGIPKVDPSASEEMQVEQQKMQDAFLKNIRAKRMIWVDDYEKGEMPVSLELKGQQLTQRDAQVLDDALRDDIIAIAKIPNYVAEIGGSGNSGAAQTAGGWLDALIDAQDQEAYWFEGLQKELAIELEICKAQGLLTDLSIEDVDFFIQRKTFDDKQSAAQVYISLRQDNIPPSKAAEIANLVADTNNLEQLWREFREQEEQRIKDNPDTPTLTAEGEPTTSASTINETRVVI